MDSSLRLLLDRAYALVYASGKDAEKCYGEFINILDQINDIEPDVRTVIRDFAEIILMFKTILKNSYLEGVTNGLFIRYVLDVFEQIICRKYCK